MIGTVKTKKSNHKNLGKKTNLAIPTALINTVLIILFVLLSYWLLAIEGANYLRKIDMMSVFFASSEFYSECMSTPGGLLTWVSCYLTQTFYYPWLGSSVYTVLLLIIAYLSIKAFGLSYKSIPLTLLMPCTILLGLLNLGYLIFSLKTPGFAFLFPIGVIITEVLLWAYRKIKIIAAQAFAVLLVSIIGYWLLGFYGLLASGLCGLYSLAAMVKSREWKRLIPGLFSFFSVYLLPQLWYRYIVSDLSYAYMYTVTLPKFYADESSLWVPYFLCFGLLILFTILAATYKPKKDISNYGYIGISAISMMCVVSLVPLRYNDANFRLTLDLDHALWEKDWNGAIDIATKNQHFEPTRINVMLKDIALLRSDKLADHLFNYRNGSAEYATTRNIRATHDAISRMISYHTGYNNFAYRWAMEYKVEYGTSIEQLKFMVKTSLLNGDYAIARKCLDNLRLTTFHSDWTKEYYKYVENPELISQDPEFSQILPLIQKEDRFIDNGGRLEGYIWSDLSTINAKNKHQLELSMVGALITQDFLAFIEKLPLYASTCERLPIHFQEAILAWDTISDDFDISPYKIDPRVSQRFQQFLNAESMYSRMNESARKEMLYPTFGDTFWYYYLYVSNLKIV